jgi:transcriptional regulator with XRE-family HTH domain
MKSNLNPEYALEIRKILGNHFKDVRLSKRLTQQELAEKMGINSITVSKIENGVWNFSLDFLILFTHHLDLYLFLPEKSKDDDLVNLMRNRHSRIADKN